MNVFFAIFGKVVLALLIVGVLVGGGIYVGRQMNKTGTTPAPTVSTTPAPVPTAIPSSTPTPVPPKTTTIKIKGDDPFGSYKIAVSDGWTQTQEQVAGRTKTTFASGDYKLTISQFAGGGAQCTYPGQSGVEMSTPFNTPVEITGIAAKFRRATAKDNPTTGPQTYTVCELQSGNWGLPTEFGYTTYNTPASPVTASLEVLDGMIASLTR